jgi:hypothetical protein
METQKVLNMKFAEDNTTKRKGLIMSAIANISVEKNNPFKAVLLEPSMISEKLGHCNDSI